jgi:hypothetical protein
MLRRLLRLWICWCIAVSIALGCSCFGSAFAQMSRQPESVFGVSGPDIADWQRLYGRAPGPEPYWYIQPVAPPMFMEPCPPRKAKRGKALNK